MVRPHLLHEVALLPALLFDIPDQDVPKTTVDSIIVLTRDCFAARSMLHALLGLSLVGAAVRPVIADSSFVIPNPEQRADLAAKCERILAGHDDDTVPRTLSLAKQNNCAY